MLRIKSAHYQPLHFPEIKDTIFFGQEKRYSDAQYAKCPTLSEEIRKGRLVILEQVRDPEAPQTAYTVAPVIQAPPEPQPAAPVAADPGVIPEWAGKMMDDMRAMVLQQQQPQAAPQDASLAPLLQQLVQKVEEIGQNSSPAVAEKLSEISRKIEGMTVSGPGVEGQVVSTATSKMEVFVPSAIRVDDLANNVNLQTKNLGQGSSVNDALAALKNLKKTST